MNPPGTGYDFVVHGQVLRFQGALLLNRLRLLNHVLLLNCLVLLNRLLLLNRAILLNCAILLSDVAQTRDY